jgi:hypothetical protein
MNIQYYAEHLIPGKDRDKLLFIAGQLSVFDDLFGSCGVDNQQQARDYAPNKPQGICVTIYSDTDPMPDTGHYFTVYADNSVDVMILASYPQWENGGIDPTKPRTIEREDYTTTLDRLLLWLRSQPPSVNTIL